MKVWQLSLITLIYFFYVINRVDCVSIKLQKTRNLNNNKVAIDSFSSNNANLDDEFNMINSFLQTSLKTKQSYDLFIKRVSKMRRKKEIIIRKTYEVTPFIGEILALTNVEKINLIVNKFFILREIDLMRKYIIMWDANSNYLSQSAKVMLNLLLCNNKFNRLRCILNILMEGLCVGDNISLQIFKELVVTVIIDTLLKTRFYYFNDLQAKFNLINILNQPFKFKSITKIKFIEKMNLSDKLKELLSFIVMRLKTNEDVDVEMNLSLHHTPPVLANNTLLYNFHPSFENKMKNMSPEERQNSLEQELQKDSSIQKEISTSNISDGNTASLFRKTLSRTEAKQILDNLKTSTNSDKNDPLIDSFSFKEKLLFENEKTNSYEYLENSILDPEHLDLKKEQKFKLSEIKEELKNDYTMFLFNQTSSLMHSLEEIEPFYQIGLLNRTIYPKYKKHIYNLIRLNELLDDFPPNMRRGSVDVSTPPLVVQKDTKTTLSREIAPGVEVSMQFKERDKKNYKPMAKDQNKVQEKFRFKSQSKIKSQNLVKMGSSTTKEEEFADKSLELLTGDNYNADKYPAEGGNNYNKITDENANDFNADSSNIHGNNFNADTSFSNNITNGNNFNQNDHDLKKIINNPENSKDIKSLINDKNVKVMFPKEIHTTYQINKKGMKTVEINTDSKNIIINLITFRPYKKINPR